MNGKKGRKGGGGEKGRRDLTVRKNNDDNNKRNCFTIDKVATGVRQWVAKQLRKVARAIRTCVWTMKCDTHKQLLLSSGRFRAGAAGRAMSQPYYNLLLAPVNLSEHAHMSAHTRTHT